MLQPARVKLDITANEAVVRPPVLRDIRHPYPDALPVHGQVRCYSFEELFAAKLRAMAQRGRPRDLYDIVDLFRRNDLRLYPEVILAALVEKCAVKDISAPTALTILNDERRAELTADWTNMLSHQLPALPPLKAISRRAADTLRMAQRRSDFRGVATQVLCARRGSGLVTARDRLGVGSGSPT